MRKYCITQNSTLKKIQLENVQKHTQTFYWRGWQKIMERRSKLLAIREMQISATMRYHYTTIRIAKIKNNGEVRVAISFSGGSSQPRNWTQVSCIARRFFTDWAMRDTCIPMADSCQCMVKTTTTLWSN